MLFPCPLLLGFDSLSLFHRLRRRVRRRNRVSADGGLELGRLGNRLILNSVQPRFPARRGGGFGVRVLLLESPRALCDLLKRRSSLRWRRGQAVLLGTLLCKRSPATRAGRAAAHLPLLFLLHDHQFQLQLSLSLHRKLLSAFKGIRGGVSPHTVADVAPSTFPQTGRQQAQKAHRTSARLRRSVSRMDASALALRISADVYSARGDWASAASARSLSSGLVEGSSRSSSLSD